MSYIMVLSIKCLACGFEFESAYQMDEESFKTTEVKDRNETCSQCGKESPQDNPISRKMVEFGLKTLGNAFTNTSLQR